MTSAIAPRPTALGYIRVRPLKKLSPTEKLVAAMLGRGYSVKQVSDLLRNKENTIRGIINDLACKIPGDLTPIDRVKAWMRGASYGTLTGRHLPALVELDQALADLRQKPPSLDNGQVPS